MWVWVVACLCWPWNVPVIYPGTGPRFSATLWHYYQQILRGSQSDLHLPAVFGCLLVFLWLFLKSKTATKAGITTNSLISKWMNWYLIFSIFRPFFYQRKVSRPSCLCIYSVSHVVQNLFTVASVVPCVIVGLSPGKCVLPQKWQLPGSAVSFPPSTHTLPFVASTYSFFFQPS